MAFTEAIKYEVKTLAQLSCCVCKSIGIEIHHIIPQSEGGTDEIDNAAPLCPSCHEMYGANPQKRKFIKESRDIWYDICAKRFSSDNDRIYQLQNDIKNLTNQLDVNVLSENIADYFFKRLKESPFFVEATDNDKSWTLADIIKFLLKYKEPTDTKVKMNLDVCYTLLYKTKGDNDEQNREYDLLRNDFIKFYGNIIARKITINLLQSSKINWFDGAPEYELQKLMNANFLYMLLLLHHKDLEPSDFSLNIIINENEDFEAWLEKK